MYHHHPQALIVTVVKEQYGLDFNKIRGENANLVYSNFGDPKAATKPYAELGRTT